MYVALLIVLAVAVAEMVLSGAFAPLYFTVGIPTYWREMGCPFPSNVLPTVDQLEAAMSRGPLPNIVFRELDASRYAFRERTFGGFFKMHYTPVMHGLLTFDREQRQIRVVGHANWFRLRSLACFL